MKKMLLGIAATCAGLFGVWKISILPRLAFKVCLFLIMLCFAVSIVGCGASFLYHTRYIQKAVGYYQAEQEREQARMKALENQDKADRKARQEKEQADIQAAIEKERIANEKIQLEIQKAETEAKRIQAENDSKILSNTAFNASLEQYKAELKKEAIDLELTKTAIEANEKANKEREQAEEIANQERLEQYKQDATAYAWTRFKDYRFKGTNDNLSILAYSIANFKLNYPTKERAEYLANLASVIKEHYQGDLRKAIDGIQFIYENELEQARKGFVRYGANWYTPEALAALQDTTEQEKPIPVACPITPAKSYAYYPEPYKPAYQPVETISERMSLNTWKHGRR